MLCCCRYIIIKHSKHGSRRSPVCALQPFQLLPQFNNFMSHQLQSAQPCDKDKLNSSHCYARSTQPKKLGERGEGMILNTQGKSYQLIANTERQGSYFTIAACLHSIRALAVSFKNVLHTAQYHQEAKTLVRPGLSHTCKLTVTGGLQN